MTATATARRSQNEGEGDYGSLSSFLSTCSTKISKRSELASDKVRHRVIIGNEAGDADSVVSALVYGHVLSLEDNLLGAGTATSDNGAAANDDGPILRYVPLVSVPRADLSLRRETTLLLEMAGIDLGSLLYIDDPPAVASLLSSGGDEANSSNHDHHRVEIVLLDHNRIQLALAHLSDNVVEILDHHEDEGYHAAVTGPRRDIAFKGQNALVGSACTLVAERLVRVTEEARGADGDNTSTDSGTIDPSAGLALLGVILLDTMNMSPEAGKGTQRDDAAIESLLERTDWSQLDRSGMNDAARAIFDPDAKFRPDREALHDLLRNSKFDSAFWAGMSAWDCLRIDYKRFEPPRASNLVPPPVRFGMSSVLLPMTDLMSKAGFVESVQHFLSNKEGGADIPLLAILALTLVEGSPDREILLTGRPDLVDAVADYLLRDESAAFLQVMEVEEGLSISNESDLVALTKGGFKMIRFQQGNTKGSRKQVAPVILKIASMLNL